MCLIILQDSYELFYGRQESRRRVECHHRCGQEEEDDQLKMKQLAKPTSHLLYWHCLM